MTSKSSAMNIIVSHRTQAISCAIGYCFIVGDDMTTIEKFLEKKKKCAKKVFAHI
jgi:hypothetical protein